VEDDSAQARVELQQFDEEGAVPATHVDDGLPVTPLDAVEPLYPSVRPLRHRAVESRALHRMRGEPGPEVGAERVGEDRLTACVEPLDGAVPNAPEEDGEVVPTTRQQELGGGCVREDPRFFLGEDAVARQSAHETVESVRVGSSFAGEILDRPGSFGEGPGNAELGNDCEGPGRNGAPARATNRLPGRDLAHARAAETTAATSSTSASVSVRQSSKRRPSRTTPITGGSASRNRGASSSSTAQAKLGSSVSGSAPPPTRPTVASTSPRTSPANRWARARAGSARSATV